MDCPDIMDLEIYVLGEGEESMRVSIGAHVLKCSTCAQEIAELSENLKVASALRREAGTHGGAAADDEPPQMMSSGAPSDLIGPYRIIRAIGQGGMGTVYEAQQENPRRVVALKMMRPGLVSRSLLSRFRHEAQILGRLRHPGIAQIYEAGTHQHNGQPQPYFVMELVRGQSLVKYAEEKKLARRDRMDLMARICDAVHHAHQQGVIHRDLKPDNILIDESQPDSLQPKILDFGVARIIDPESQTQTLHTSAGQIVGTVAYMSPEQANADPGSIDTRSDVYALGVICYQLVSGQLPYRLNTASVAESVRAIVQDEPTPLSTVDRSLRGDVTTIVGKALEKDKSRRYQSAAEMAADIRRHLRDEPITAVPPSTVYQLKKFARRNKGLVAGVALAFVLLICGVIGTSIGLVRARANAVLARSEADKAKAINRFMEKMLASANPNSATSTNANAGRDVKVVQLLNDASKQLDAGELAKQPAVEAAIRRTLGSTYGALAEFPAAEQHVRKALQIHRELYGNLHEDVASDLDGLAILVHAQGRLQDAKQLYLESLETRRKLYPTMTAELAESLNNYGAILKDTGNLAEAEQLFLQALDARRKIFGEEHEAVAGTLNLLAVAQLHQGRGAEAEQSLRKALAMRRKLVGDKHPVVATTFNDLGAVLYMDHRPAEAEPFYREALLRRTEVFGDDHPDVAESRSGLAVVLREQKKFSEAETMLRQSLAVQRRILGNENHAVASTLGNLGAILRDQNKLDEAEQVYRDALAINRKTLGDVHPTVGLALSNLGSLILSQGRPADAEPLLREAISIFERQPVATLSAASSRALSQAYLGGCLLALKSFDEGERVLLEAVKFFRANATPNDRRLQLAHSYLAKLYDAWNKPEKAAEYRALLPATQPSATTLTTKMSATQSLRADCDVKAGN